MEEDPGGRAVTPLTAGIGRCLQSTSTLGRSRSELPTSARFSTNWIWHGSPAGSGATFVGEVGSSSGHSAHPGSLSSLTL